MSNDKVVVPANAGTRLCHLDAKLNGNLNGPFAGVQGRY